MSKTADLKEHLQDLPLKDLLEASYDKGITDVNGFKKDESLSTGKTKVFVNEEGKTVVAHKGTDGVKDWANNFAYAVGGNALYKTTDRYKQAKKTNEKQKRNMDERMYQL